jgi:hypothetical protein
MAAASSRANGGHLIGPLTQGAIGSSLVSIIVPLFCFSLVWSVFTEVVRKTGRKVTRKNLDFF